MYVPQGLNNTSAATGEQVVDQSEKEIEGVPVETQPLIDETEVREFIVDCQTQAEKAYTALRKIWDECWDMYRSIQDNSKKKEWQAKVFIPEAPASCEKAAALMRRILMRSDQYFDMEKRSTRPGNPMMDSMMDANRNAQVEAIKYHLEQVKALNIFTEAMKSGFVLGVGIVKWWWEPYEKVSFEYQETMSVDWSNGYAEPKRESYFDKVTKQLSRLKGAVVNPKMCWWDTNRSYFIEESTTTLDEVIRLAEAGIYDMGQVDKLKADYGTDDVESERLKALGLEETSSSFKKRVHLYEYWGDLYNREGIVIKRNCRIVLANKQWVLNIQNIDNPFWHGKTPYVIFDPIAVLFRKDGRSLIDGIRTIQKALNDLVCMSLDGLLFKLAKMLEVDPDQLRYPEQLKSLRPGKPILRKGPGPAIHEVPISDVPVGALNEGELLRRAIQNYTGVTDYLMGNPQIKGENATATEVQIKTSESNATFEGIARTIEEDLIEDSVEMVRQLLLQYWEDFEDPVFVDISQKYGIPFAGPREKRVSFLSTDDRVIVRGISMYFQKIDDLRKYLEFMGIVGKVQPFMYRVKVRELLDRILLSFNFANVDRLLVNPQEEMIIEQAERMRMMMSLMPPPGMGMPPPPGMQGGGGPPQGRQDKPKQLGGRMPTPPMPGMPPGGQPNRQTITNQPVGGIDNKMM